MLFRQIKAGVPVKPKTDHAPELFFLAASHDFCTDLFVWDVIRIGAGFRIFIEIFIILFSGIAEQGKSIVKNGSGSDDFTAVIIPQNTEIPEMPVFIVNQRIENQHAADLLRKCSAMFIVPVQAGGDSAGLDNASDGDIGGINVSKQCTFGSGDSFPVFQIIMYCV